MIRSLLFINRLLYSQLRVGRKTFLEGPRLPNSALSPALDTISGRICSLQVHTMLLKKANNIFIRNNAHQQVAKYNIIILLTSGGAIVFYNILVYSLARGVRVRRRPTITLTRTLAAAVVQHSRTSRE